MSSRDFPGWRQTVNLVDSPVLILSLPILPYFKSSKNIIQKEEFFANPDSCQNLVIRTFLILNFH